MSSYRKLLAYFVPLALQGMSQSLTYPLSVMVAARGEGGTIAVAGFSQSTTVWNLLTMIGIGLLTSGMVYVRSPESYARFRRVNTLFIVATSAAHLLLMLPPVAHLIFATLMGLPPEIERPAYICLVTALPMNILFSLRYPSTVVLMNDKATGRVFWATVGRVLATAGLGLFFCRIGAVGVFWAIVCLTIPVGLEAAALHRFARPHVRALPAGVGPPPRHSTIAFFGLTLSVGWWFMILSGFLVGAFAARAPRPEIMLAVYYLAAGAAGPVMAGASRMQPLALAFYGQSRALNAKLVAFMLLAGLALSALPLLLILPGPDRFYYGRIQNLALEHLPLVREAAGMLLLVPFTVALRTYSEGLAAYLQRPITVLAGQAVYLAAVAVACFFSLNLGVPGHLIGGVASLAGNLLSAGVVLLAIRWEQEHPSAPPLAGL